MKEPRKYGAFYFPIKSPKSNTHEKYTLFSTTIEEDRDRCGYNVVQ